MKARTARVGVRAVAAVGALLASTFAISIPASTSAAGAAPVCRSWGATQPPNVGSANNQLRGVAVVSTCSAWAVGQYSNGGDSMTLIEHWNGSAWRVQSSPSPGAGSDILFAVTAASTRSAWAVGSSNDGLLDQTFVLHWNGHAWKRQTSPNVAGVNNTLEGVAAFSPTNVWAVGYAATSPLRTLIEHWNGHAWKIVKSPNAAGDNLLSGIDGSSKKDIWAVGNRGSSPRTLVEHWNGHAWKIVQSPNPGSVQDVLTSVSAVSSKDAWTVGYRFDGVVTRTLATPLERPRVEGGGQPRRRRDDGRAGRGRDDLGVERMGRRVVLRRRREPRAALPLERPCVDEAAAADERHRGRAPRRGRILGEGSVGGGLVREHGEPGARTALLLRSTARR